MTVQVIVAAVSHSLLPALGFGFVCRALTTGALTSLKATLTTFRCLKRHVSSVSPDTRRKKVASTFSATAVSSVSAGLGAPEALPDAWTSSALPGVRHPRKPQPPRLTDACSASKDCTVKAVICRASAWLAQVDIMRVPCLLGRFTRRTDAKNVRQEPSHREALPCLALLSTAAQRALCPQLLVQLMTPKRARPSLLGCTHWAERKRKRCRRPAIQDRSLRSPRLPPHGTAVFPALGPRTVLGAVRLSASTRRAASAPTPTCRGEHHLKMDARCVLRASSGQLLTLCKLARIRFARLGPSQMCRAPFRRRISARVAPKASLALAVPRVLVRPAPRA